MYNVINNLQDIIPSIPYLKKGKYNKDLGTFVLIGGSSYKSIYFDKFNVDKNDKFYNISKINQLYILIKNSN